MFLRILGPLDMSHEQRTVPLGGRRQQTVLAMLALNLGQVTSTYQLIEAVWRDDPPMTSRAQVQTAVSALRKLFVRAGYGAAIHTEGPGYMLDLDTRLIDSLSFMESAAIAARQRRSGLLAEAADTLREALGLWRGPALMGIESEAVRRSALVLDEKRLEAVEELSQLDLQLGRHKNLTLDLPPLITEHPYREQLYEYLILALYRCGRQAEALTVFREARSTLLEQMGVEPGPELHRLERAILNQSTDLDAPEPNAARPASTRDRTEPTKPEQIIPRQLPPSSADFTGRTAQIEEIWRVTCDDSTEAMPITVISGLGGAGKSALAIRAAHMLSPRFPDGVLYTDFQGLAMEDCHDRLGGFLRSLRVPPHLIPDDLTERAALFRSCLATKSVLVLLDGVSCTRKLLNLLPGSPRCRVIAVSRNRLPDLPGAQHVDVPPLTGEESYALLEKILGTERVALEPGATAELAALCDGLPLALRIVGAKLNSCMRWPIRRLVERLRNERGRLDGLRHYTWELRSVLDSMYEGLGGQERRLFRFLGLAGVSRISPWTAAALSDTDPLIAETLLEGLRNACLLEAADDRWVWEERYRLRRLVQIYAHERFLATETREEAKAARRRAFPRCRPDLAGSGGPLRALER